MTVTVDQVRSVYSGRNGKCCCGCSGKHRYARAYRQEASQNRGYPVGDEEVNDLQVAKIIRIINENDPQGGPGSASIWAVNGNRLYVAYLTNAASKRLHPGA